MDVADQLQQILVFVADDGFIPALEHVAGFAVAEVEVLAVGLLEPLHELGQVARGRSRPSRWTWLGIRQ